MDEPKTTQPDDPTADAPSRPLQPRDVLQSGVVLRGLFAFVALVLVLLGRERLDVLVDDIVGIAFVIAGIVRLLRLRKSFRWEDALVAAGLVGIGIALALVNFEGEDMAGRIIGLGLAIVGVVDFVAGVRGRIHGRHDWLWRTIRGLVIITIAALAMLWPGALAFSFAAIVGVFWIFQAVVAVAYSLQVGSDHVRVADPEDTERMVGEWLDRYRMDGNAIAVVDDKLFYEGAAYRGRLFRFSVLMGLATGIATFGIASDSTAVVIGAMLIAPLMTPILGFTGAMLKGWTGRALRTGFIVVGGSLGAIALSFLLASLIPDLATVMNNGQVQSRVSPSLLDLAIAVLAGLAGAYAITRPDVADSLPGVAVAVALVPPLTVVGIALRADQPADAGGAIVLFLTNLLAIVLAASLVFVLSGYTSWEAMRARKSELRTSYATLGLGLLLVSIPLVITGRDVVGDAVTERAIDAAVDEWLGGSDTFESVNVTIANQVYEVTVVGQGDAPDTDQLADLIEESVGGPFTLEVRVIPETIDTVQRS